MIRILKYNVTKVNEDGESYLKMDCKWLREDLGWRWIPTIDYSGNQESLDRKLARLRNEGYEIFKEES